MSVIHTAEEKEKLSCMYAGDKSRDASSSIRGFLFQDYIAINCLLQEGVEYVCSEYLEDVDAFYGDDRFEFIQVKYYPKTEPNLEEISSDLYYQYLRLKLLGSNLKAAPRLFIHGKSKIAKPSLADVTKYVAPGGILQDSVNYPQDPGAWLIDHVYLKDKKDKQGNIQKGKKKQTKGEQKSSLFSAVASKQTLKEFTDALEVVNLPDIEKYKKDLMDALAKAYPNPDRSRKEAHWKLILLGFALLQIQQRYSLEDPDFEQLRVTWADFDRQLREAAAAKPERTIAGYLVGAASEEYERIMKRNDLSQLQVEMLERIYRNTVRWLAEAGATVEGQYQLLNTLSTDEADEIAGYEEMDPADQLNCIAACKRDFRIFLDYLWKIMLDICQEKVADRTQLVGCPELFDPKHYIDPSVREYVCLNFPEDRYIQHSVILPQAGVEFKGVKRRITERMVTMPNRPGKWFFANGDLKRGKNYYNYSTANISENPTVADLGEDTFYIECMECIRIGEGEWCDREVCRDCIFSMKCVKEGTAL